MTVSERSGLDKAIKYTEAARMESTEHFGHRAHKGLRMVVKIGSSSITDVDGRLSDEKLERIVEQVSELVVKRGWQVVLVSSGAVAAGIGKLGWRRATITMPEKQAAASVGQGLLMHRYEQLFHRRGISIGQVLLTRSDVEDRSRFVHIRNTMMTLLRFGIIPVVNENDTVAVEEIRFGDNDTLASLVALVTEADQLALLTDINGLYTANPAMDKSATLIRDVYEITPEVEESAGGAGSSVGTGGMRTKVTAAKMAVAGGCDVVVAASAEPEVLLHVAEDFERKVGLGGAGTEAGAAVSVGAEATVQTGSFTGAATNTGGETDMGTATRIGTGTRFHAKTIPVSLRKAWIIHGSKPEGTVFIDEGAASALINRAASLLLPGVVGVSGDFREGATIEIAGPDATVLGRGIVSLAAHDLELLLGRKKAGEQLHDLPEVVHRNDMALFSHIAPASPQSRG